MANANLSLAEKMDKVEKMAFGALQPEVLAVMVNYGYGAAQVKPVEALVAQARQKISRYDLEFAEKLESTAAATAIREEFKNRFTTRFGFCKIAFENDAPIYDALRLSESIKKTDTGMREQGDRFFTSLKANPTWISSLSQFSISEELISEDMLVLKELKVAESSQMKESEEAKAAVVDRDKTLDQLFDWADRYKKVAKLALKGNEKLLGMVGL